MRKFLIFVIFVISTALLAGCERGRAEPLSKEEYVAHLSAAICQAVNQARENEQSVLEPEFFADFESSVQNYVKDVGIARSAWLAAKEEYFTADEHQRLIKLNFTTCAIGL